MIGVNGTPTALIHAELRGSSAISLDGGKSFAMTKLTTTADGQTGFAFVDNDDGVLTSYRNGGKWIATNDGGKNQSETNYSEESWSIYGVADTSIFYAAPEGSSFHTDIRSNARRSNDYGMTWNVLQILDSVVVGILRVFVRSFIYKRVPFAALIVVVASQKAFIVQQTMGNYGNRLVNQVV